MVTRSRSLVVVIVFILSVMVGGQSASWAADFYASPQEVRPVLVGTQVPDGDLKAIDGSSTSLSASLGGKPGVVVFYRGNW